MDEKIQLITKYQQVAEIIEEKIKTGEYLPGTKIPSERELAKQYSISHMTANKAMSLLVAKGLLKRVHGNGTFIIGDGNFVSTKLVALAIPADIQNHPLFYPLLPDALQTQGYFPLILNTNTPDIFEKFEKVMEQKPKAAIVEPKPSLVEKIIRFEQYENIVFIHHPVPGIKEKKFNVIYFDYVAAGYAGMKTLFSLNKKKTLILSFERIPGSNADLFLKGCENAMNEFKIGEFHCVDTNKMDETDFEKIFLEKHFDSILSLGDFRIIPVLKVLQKLGLKVPDDIFIIGTYNTPWAEIYGITSISINQQKIIDDAILCIKENRKGYVKRVEPYIVFRNSCPKIERR